MNLSDTYDRYGQEISNYDAGDYHFDNSASDAVMDCKKAIEEKFLIDTDNIHVVDEGENTFCIDI